MKKMTLSALAAAGILASLATGATAADLGGNCCADLEERVAELEATTARKGNRKVSLTVSGWVTENVVWFDDGVESNTYVAGSGTTLASNVKFTGQATIAPGWTAGYVIHLEADGNEGLLGYNQAVPNGANVIRGGINAVTTLQSYWFVKSDTYGKVGVGLQSQASDNTAILVDGSGSLVPANYVQFDYGGMLLRTNAGALSATSISAVRSCMDCNGLPENVVRYDSPTFAGFSASASWGQDDMWDVALRYGGEVAGFKIAVAGAYAESTEAPTPGVGPVTTTNLMGQNTEFFQIGGYAQHIATGLFVYGAYTNFQGPAATGVDDEAYYVKAGLRQRWTSLGHTVLYGEYQQADQGGNAAIAANGNFELWGLGAVQEIDNAAMSLWLTYRNVEADNGVVGANRLSIDYDQVKFGALINF